MSDGDENLAGTAKPARALISATTATRAGVADGQLLTVSTDRGAVTVPAEIADLPDDVVWLPTNARGCAVRSSLGAVAGDAVTIRPAGAVATPRGGAQ
jgi:NADH-quinone oxidoreductase subunit G